MRLSLLTTIAVALCVLPSPARVGSVQDGPFREASALVRAAIDRGDIPGAVLLVGQRGETLLHEAYGQRALQPAREPMTKDTVFDLASLTKPVATASSVMQLVEAGKVRLIDPVAKYLPEFGAAGKQAITVEHLLRHWGGLIPDNALEDYGSGPEEAWRKICALEPKTPPGAEFRYTDVGYIVLGELVKRVSGKSLDEFAREHVFTPLGMRETTFLPGPELARRSAPTEERGQGWMCGEVHDPRAYALGGVAGHAGLFSTAADLSLWCQMMLGLERGGLSRTTVLEMSRPRWLKDGRGGRALGLDCDTGYSSARGAVFPRGRSVGHTGFTGTALWIDRGTGAYYILLTNRVHPDGGGSKEIRELRYAVATAVGRVLRPEPAYTGVLTGADVLARDGCRQLAGRRVGLITNTTGRTRDGERVVDLLARAADVELVRVLTPEHGFDAILEGAVDGTVDQATKLPVHSLYGETRRPTAEMLAGIDTLVFDVQGAGARFYTYMTTLGYAMEAAAERGLSVVVLDRPNPIGPVPVAGPCADEDRLSFVAYQPIPVVHGMTLGELALMFQGRFGVDCELEVVPCEGWQRSMWWDETGLPWMNPSPNLRKPAQTLLYPAIGLMEATNLSVGRGTDEPFERFGAPWMDGKRLAATLTAAQIPGLCFVPIEFTPTTSKFEGELCGGVHVAVTDRNAVRPVEAGLTIAWHINRLFGADFEAAKIGHLLRDQATFEALMKAADPNDLPRVWHLELEAFRATRERFLLQQYGV